MKKVHLKITEIPNHPTAKAYSFTACGQSLGSNCRKLEAVPDFRAVTCIRCQLSDIFYKRKEEFMKREAT